MHKCETLGEHEILEKVMRRLKGSDYWQVGTIYRCSCGQVIKDWGYQNNVETLYYKKTAS